MVLDSGSTISSRPPPLFNAIGADCPGATLNSGFWVVDCAVGNQPGTVDFGFGGITIHVPYHEFIWHANDDTLCVLGVRAATDNTFILGGN